MIAQLLVSQGAGQGTGAGQGGWLLARLCWRCSEDAGQGAVAMLV